MSKSQINQPSNQETASEEVNRLLYAFLFLALIPVVLLGFVVTLFKPELRSGISDFLATGFFIFMGILGFYWAVRQAKV